MALDQWEDKELITKAKMNAMVDAINENTDGVAQGGGSVKSVNGVSPDSKGNVNTPKTDLSGYATKESVTNAQNTANSAQAAVDGLEIGAKNLIRNTTDFSGWSNLWGGMTTTRLQTGGVYRYKGVKNDARQSGLTSVFPISLSTADQVVLTFTLNSDFPKVQIYQMNSTGGSNAAVYEFAPNTEDTEYTVKFSPKFTDSGSFFAFADNGGRAGNYIELVGQTVMLIKGNISTDWTPAPEDKANDSEVGHLADDQTWAGVNNFNNLQINGQNLDDYIATQIAKSSGGGTG